MKKIITKIMAVILLTVCALSLVACGVGPKPNLDLEKAYKTMKLYDYEVDYYDDYDYIPTIEEILAVRDLSGNSLTITKYGSLYMAKLAFKERKLNYEGTLREYEVEIEILRFNLSEYEDEMTETEIALMQNNLEKLIEEYENYKADFCYGRSGKYVWYGHNKIIEETK